MRLEPLDDGVMRYRGDVHPGDVRAVREIVSSTKVFSAEEEAIAVELVEEHLAKGIKSGYLFLVAEHGESAVGYTCFGPIPATKASYDLYWIAVRADYYRRGLGRRLLARSEAEIRRFGGGRVYVETSSRAEYSAARALYASRGYERVAVLEDYYAAGDAKIIYVKVLDSIG